MGKHKKGILQMLKNCLIYRDPYEYLVDNSMVRFTCYVINEGKSFIESERKKDPDSIVMSELQTLKYLDMCYDTSLKTDKTIKKKTYKNIRNIFLYRDKNGMTLEDCY